MDEAYLVLQLKQGNKLAFNSIYNIYVTQVYTIAYKYLCSKELAEDATQNLFLKLWVRKDEIDEKRPLNRYLFTVLKNDLLNILRSSKKDVYVLDDCLELLNSIDGATDEEEREVKELQVKILNDSLERLSPQRRKIFSLKMSGEYTNQEIADEMKLSVNTIKFQYSQALKQVKEFVRHSVISILF